MLAVTFPFFWSNFIGINSSLDRRNVLGYVAGSKHFGSLSVKELCYGTQQPSASRGEAIPPFIAIDGGPIPTCSVAAIRCTGPTCVRAEEPVRRRGKGTRR